jgi:hypothetical protein
VSLAFGHWCDLQKSESSRTVWEFHEHETVANICLAAFAAFSDPLVP